MTRLHPNRRTPPRVILASGFQPDYVREVANAYANNGYSVEVIGGDMHAHLAFAPGVTFLNFRGRDAREPNRLREVFKLARYYLRLLRHVTQVESRVLYDVSIGRPFLRCMLMYSAFRLVGVRIIYTAHNVVPHDGDTIVSRVIHHAIYRVLASAILVHGETLKRRLVTEFRIAPEKVTVVHHGTYHPPNDPALDRRKARDILGISPEVPVVLIFGYQRPYKGTHFVLESLAEDPIDDIYVLIRGNTTDQAYRDRLLELIANHAASYSVDAILAPVPDADVEVLFKACDMVLLPYLEGSQSGVKYMAYAYGRPVLASDLGSLAEFIQPGLTGEVFVPADRGSFLGVLRQMLSSLDTYDEARIQSVAYGEYSFEAAMARVETIHARLEKGTRADLATQEDAT